MFRGGGEIRPRNWMSRLDSSHDTMHAQFGEEELLKEAEAVVAGVRRRAGLGVSGAGGGDHGWMEDGDDIGVSTDDDNLLLSRVLYEKKSSIGSAWGVSRDGWGSTGVEGGWGSDGNCSPSYSDRAFLACGETPPTVMRRKSPSCEGRSKAHFVEAASLGVECDDTEEDAANLLRKWIDGDVACSVESLLPLEGARHSLSGHSSAGDYLTDHTSEGDTGGSSRWRSLYGRDTVRRSVSSGLPIAELTPLERATEASSRRGGARDYVREVEGERLKYLGSRRSASNIAAVLEMRHEELAGRRRERSEQQQQQQQHQQVAGAAAKRPPSGAGGGGGGGGSGLRKKQEQRRLEAEMRRIDAESEARRRRRGGALRPSVALEMAEQWMQRARGGGGDVGVVGNALLESSECPSSMHTSGCASPIPALSPRKLSMPPREPLRIDVGGHVADFSSALKARLRHVTDEVMSNKADPARGAEKLARLPWEGHQQHPFRVRGGGWVKHEGDKEDEEGCAAVIFRCDASDAGDGGDASVVPNVGQEQEAAIARTGAKEVGDGRRSVVNEFARRAVEGRVQVRRVLDMQKALRAWGGEARLQAAMRRKVRAFRRRHQLGGVLGLLVAHAEEQKGKREERQDEMVATFRGEWGDRAARRAWGAWWGEARDGRGRREVEKERMLRKEKMNSFFDRLQRGQSGRESRRSDGEALQGRVLSGRRQEQREETPAGRHVAQGRGDQQITAGRRGDEGEGDADLENEGDAAFEGEGDAALEGEGDAALEGVLAREDAGESLGADEGSGEALVSRELQGQRRLADGGVEGYANVGLRVEGYANVGLREGKATRPGGISSSEDEDEATPMELHGEGEGEEEEEEHDDDARTHFGDADARTTLTNQLRPAGAGVFIAAPGVRADGSRIRPASAAPRRAAPVAEECRMVASMRERERVRKERRNALLEKYETARRAKEEEEEARREREEEEAKAHKAAHAEARRERIRQEREKELRRAIAAERRRWLEELADVHFTRATLVWRGIVPWRQAVELRERQVRARWEGKGLQRALGCWRRWAAWERGVMAAGECAQRHVLTVVLKRVAGGWSLRAWRGAVEKVRCRLWDARMRREEGMTRRAMHSWLGLIVERAVVDAMLAEKADFARVKGLMRGVWREWDAAVAEGRFERAREKKREGMHGKVNGWIAEFRANRAKEGAEKLKGIFCG